MNRFTPRLERLEGRNMPSTTIQSSEHVEYVGQEAHAAMIRTLEPEHHESLQAYAIPLRGVSHGVDVLAAHHEQFFVFPALADVHFDARTRILHIIEFELIEGFANPIVVDGEGLQAVDIHTNEGTFHVPKDTREIHVNRKIIETGDEDVDEEVAVGVAVEEGTPHKEEEEPEEDDIEVKEPEKEIDTAEQTEEFTYTQEHLHHEEEVKHRMLHEGHAHSPEHEEEEEHDDKPDPKKPQPEKKETPHEEKKDGHSKAETQKPVDEQKKQSSDRTPASSKPRVSEEKHMHPLTVRVDQPTEPMKVVYEVPVAQEQEDAQGSTVLAAAAIVAGAAAIDTDIDEEKRANKASLRQKLSKLKLW